MVSHTLYLAPFHILNYIWNVKKLILPTLITLLISLLFTYYLFKWFNAYSIDPKVQNIFTVAQLVKLYITLFIYFFALITLPFLSRELIQFTKLKEADWWKALVAYELFSLVFAYLFSPPDIFSKIILFIMCQLIVLINCIVIKRKLNTNQI